MNEPRDEAAVDARARFTPERLQWITQVEQGHFWHAPRRRLLMRLVEQQLSASADGDVLDVGCGSGRFVQALRERGHDAYGVDPHDCAATSNEGWFALGLAESLPFASGRFTLVTALDSLEHVDDAKALHEIARVLRPGGRLVASVPAHDWLWSARDVRAGHLRRYDRARLRQRVHDAGFEITQVSGYQFFLLPLLAASRLWQPGRVARGAGTLAEEDWPSAPLNSVLRLVNDCEVALARWLPMPTGSSLIVVARKRREHGTAEAQRVHH